MEGTTNKILVLIVLLFFSVLTVNAQKKDLAYYRCAFFESYRAGTMAPWPGLIAEMEKAKSTDLTWQIELVKAMYGLVGYEIGSKNKDLARVYVNKADVYLDKLLKDYPQNAQIHSLAGAFYGYKISLSFYMAPFYGPKSLSQINKAIELDPNEPAGYIEKGNSLQYRPAALGGDKKEALALYRKALKLMENRNDLSCSWQQMLLRAFILKTLYETNQTSEAETFIQEMQKDYGSMSWIKQFVGANYMDGK
jgi:tetratricopeptide (TPR) repeat protein